MTKRLSARVTPVNVKTDTMDSASQSMFMGSTGEMPTQYIDSWHQDSNEFGALNGWSNAIGVDQSSANHMVIGDMQTVETSANGLSVGGVKRERLPEPKQKRKKRDRFNGMSEDEVLQRLLPDHLIPDLDIVIIGINPGLTAAYVGHHYAGPGNHFWKCLYLAGFLPQPMNAYDDYRLKEFGIGFTNIVSRTTRGSSDLTRKEIREGADVLAAKIHKFNPKIAVFNGKGIYEVFSGSKNFHFGKQPEPFPGTNVTVFVMPSSSARCAQLPRAVDKLPFYVALRQLRDYLCGTLPDLDLSTVTFPDRELKAAASRVKMDGYIKTEEDIKTSSTRARNNMTSARASASRTVINPFPDQFREPAVPAKRGRKAKQDPTNAMTLGFSSLPVGLSLDMTQSLKPRLLALPHAAGGVEEQICIKIEADEDEEEERIMASTVESRVAHWVNTSPFETSRPDIDDLGFGLGDSWQQGNAAAPGVLTTLPLCNQSSVAADSVAASYSGMGASRPQAVLYNGLVVNTRPQNVVACNGLVVARPHNGILSNGLVANRSQTAVARNGMVESRLQNAATCNGGLVVTRTQDALSSNRLVSSRPQNTVSYGGMIVEVPGSYSGLVTSRADLSASYSGMVAATRPENGLSETAYGPVSARKLLDGCAGIAAAMSRYKSTYRERSVGGETGGFSNGMYMPIGHIHPTI